MKTCPLCSTTYEDWIDFCFSDGMPLVAMGGASSPLRVTAATEVAEAAPRLTDAAELPSSETAPPPEAPAAAVGHGDEAPGRPAPAAPPSDITGIFTGGIYDEDGEEFRRPTPVPTLNLTIPSAADLPSASKAVQSAFDEHSQPTALNAASVPASDEPAAPVQAAAVASESSVSDATAAEVPAGAAAEVADLFAAFDAASASASTVEAPEPEAVAPAEKKGGMGMIFGGVALGVVALIGVLGVGMMGGETSKPEATPAAAVAVAPVAPPVVAPAPPVEAPAAPVEPVAPPVAAAPAAPVVAPPVPAAGAPVAAAKPVPAAVEKPVAPVAPTAKPAAAAAVAPPPQPAPRAAAAEADPWGAPTAATSGVLKIVTDPDGATVYVNDKQRGKTPLTVELPYGMQNIRVVRGGYKTEVRDVNIGVASLTVPFTLKPELVTGAVNVYGPAGYHVLVDGFDRGPMPVTVQVNEGVRQFKLVSDAGGANCSLPKEIKFRTPGRPETVTLSCP
jgi:hypothetical protein